MVDQLQARDIPKVAPLMSSVGTAMYANSPKALGEGDQLIPEERAEHLVADRADLVDRHRDAACHHIVGKVGDECGPIASKPLIAERYNQAAHLLREGAYGVRGIDHGQE